MRHEASGRDSGDISQRVGEHVHVRRWGAGPTLITLHGLGASGEQARPFFAADDGWSILAPDFPGHGRSDPGAFSFQNFATIVLGLAASRDEGRVDLFGCSMGCGVALAFALANPQMVHSLVLVRPAWLDQPARPQLDLIERVGAWALAEGRERALDLLVRDADYLNIARRQPLAAASLRELLREEEPPMPTALTAMVADRPFDALSELRHFDVPAVVIGGEEDLLHPVEVAVTLAGALPRARFLLGPPRYARADEHFAAVRSATAELHATLEN